MLLSSLSNVKFFFGVVSCGVALALVACEILPPIAGGATSDIP